MRSLISIAIAGALLLDLAGPAMAQPVLDCSKAKSAAEQAICSDRGLASADAEMAKAYASLRTALPAGERATLLESQRQWVMQRAAACRDAGPELVQCLLRETQDRRRFLAGIGPNDDAGAPRLLPRFYRDAGRHYTISIDYPQIAGSTGAAAFNKQSRAIAFGTGDAAAGEIRDLDPPTDASIKNFYEAGYEITYLDPRLVSVVFSVGTYTGGVHPNGASSALLFDFGRGRPLRLDDLLAAPTEAIPAVAALCRRRAETEDWGLFDDPDFASVVSEIAMWSVRPDGVEIQFNPYSVTPYVVGPHQCRVSYAELSQWLKPGGPVPPDQADKPSATR